MHASPRPNGRSTARLFTALVLADDGLLEEAIAPMRAAAPSLRWLDPASVHLTLRFLGATATDRIPSLTAALRDIAAPAAPVVLEVGGAGAFPSLAHPRVLWLRVTLNAGLAALYHAVDAACARLGFAREPRPFCPHLTVARAPRGGPMPPADVARAAAAAGPSFPTPVLTLDLYASALTPSGARHQRLAALPLGARPAIRGRNVPAPQAR